MVYSQQGLGLTEQFEGCSLAAYEDPAGVLTIGYGHTGSDFNKDSVWTQNQCQIALINDVQTAEAAVNKLVTVVLTQSQFDALVDFTFNVGTSAFGKSTLLKLINEGQMKEAELEFNRWIYAKGKTLPGLVKRRLAEANLFMT